MKKLEQEIDFYYDENDNIVLTEAYHLKKGYCCGHGCRHSPYDYENVPQPRRNLLLKQRIHADEKSNKTS